MQNGPVGEELYAAKGRRELDIWVADTEHGSPWVVLGTATSEAEFWQQVEEDEDLRSICPIHPARWLRVFFATESDYSI